MEIGFIGLGHMGRGIAHNLLKAGHDLTVYNRSRDKADALAREGARIAENPAEAAAHRIVFTMLADDDALQSVVDGSDGILSALPQGGIHVGMSTISVALTRHLSQTHTESGRHYVAAPVFGRPDAAEAAKLFIAIAGPSEAVGEVEPLLGGVAQTVVRFGVDPAHAAITKISGNFMLQTAIEAMGEALALVRKHGVDPAAYLDFMTSTVFTAPFYKAYGGAIVAEKYLPAGFPIPLAMKDTRLALEAADGAEVPLPLADVIHDRFLIALAHGWDDLDMAALGRVAAVNAGVGH